MYWKKKKNSINLKSSENALQKWRPDKDIFRKLKTERIYNQQTCTVKICIKKNSPGWRENDANMSISVGRNEKHLKGKKNVYINIKGDFKNFLHKTIAIISIDNIFSGLWYIRSKIWQTAQKVEGVGKWNHIVARF